ncbi:MAG: hypothetical protein LBJ04_09500 [Sphingobacterium sp.]|jgi:hypothetical protein|uniref:hypothetical protein n=1 Tax=Sphingobacterium sp. TaxID=341027 RepID=UPI00281E8237|nr:hypothetical protein [Sphingobacterium sp.]MDR0263449.1 hypothetical protein [Sphingobacterium sp.]
MELTHSLDKSNEVTSGDTRKLLQGDVEVQKKGISMNFILGFFVFLYKTAIKP